MDINKIIMYLEENLRDGVTLDQISRKFDYSKYHISRVFNRNAKLTLAEYMNARRMSEAAIALLESDKSITEVALTFSFNSSSYFSMLFKQTFGITPKEYRKSNHYIYLQNSIRIGAMKMYKDINQQVKYISENIGVYNDMLQLLGSLENTVLIKQEDFILEYVTTTVVEEGQNNYSGHILWHVTLNLLTNEYDKVIIRNTSFVKANITSVYKEDNEIRIEALNSETNETFKSKLVKKPKRKYMLDFYNFEENVLKASKVLNQQDSYINKNEAKEILSELLFKVKNNNEYLKLIETNKNLISHSFVRDHDVVSYLQNTDKYTSLITAIVNFKEQKLSEITITNIPNFEKKLSIYSIEKDLYSISNGVNQICRLRFVRGQELSLYNSSYRILNDNGSTDIY